MKYQLLPPLSLTEYEDLKADIRAHGVLVPIILDVDGNIIDGHHRHQIATELGITNYPTVTHEFSSEEEKQAVAIGLNVKRRHLSPEQSDVMRNKLYELIERLRGQGMTQHAVAALSGVPRGTIARWEADGSVQATDLRLTIPRSYYQSIIARVEGGESLDSVAGDFKVSPTRIRQIVDSIKNASLVTRTIVEYVPQYGIIVICSGEEEQAVLYNELHVRGLQCKVVVT